jgi:hypothetical protein
MLRNLLTSVIIWVYDVYKNFVSIPDYRIQRAAMEYFIDNDKEFETDGEFWEGESKKWDGLFDEHYVESQELKYRKETIPANVKKVIIRVKYWYNDKLYKYLTYKTQHEWPPPSEPGMVFSIPLVSAHLVDTDGKPVKDILGKIKRYAGPRGDFHGEKVRIRDMLYYDEETLATMYPNIRLKNVFGKTKTVSTLDGYVTDLRVL